MKEIGEIGEIGEIEEIEEIVGNKNTDIITGKDNKIDEIIFLLKSLKQLKDIELGKQNEKLTKFRHVEDLLKSIKQQNDNIKELNVNINELIKQNGQIIKRLTIIANSNLCNMIIIVGVLLSINYGLIVNIINHINKKNII